jgi:hypothetical protein
MHAMQAAAKTHVAHLEVSLSAATSGGQRRAAALQQQLDSLTQQLHQARSEGQARGELAEQALGREQARAAAAEAARKLADEQAEAERAGAAELRARLGEVERRLAGARGKGVVMTQTGEAAAEGAEDGEAVAAGVGSVTGLQLRVLSQRVAQLEAELAESEGARRAAKQVDG